MTSPYGVRCVIYEFSSVCEILWSYTDLLIHRRLDICLNVGVIRVRVGEIINTSRKYGEVVTIPSYEFQLSYDAIESAFTV